MKRNIRFGALMLVFVLLVSLLSPVYAGQNVIRISSAEELLRFAENCRLDSWSQGKTVLLTKDIMLKKSAFLPIPSFGGTFDGQGHTVSGLNLSKSVVPAGLFGTVQEGGVVKNVTLKGSLLMGEDCTMIGGIAGRNYGSIEACSFDGTIRGGSVIGGIVGVNMQSGRIDGCTSTGKVISISKAGGIVGENAGSVLSCRNEAQVDTESMDVSVGTKLLNLTSLEEILSLSSADTLDAASDVGGIAGYSSGWLTDCVNVGTVGYAHSGYNIGGIVGRSCGYVASCKNEGEVLGRKDVGGVAGQAEPYIVVNLSKDSIDRIVKELKTLNDRVKTAISNGRNSADNLLNSLNNIHSGVTAAERQADDTYDRIHAYADQTYTQINRTSDLVRGTFSQLQAVWAGADAPGSAFSAVRRQLDGAMMELSTLPQTAAAVETAISLVGQAQSLYEEGSAQVQQGMSMLSSAILSGDNELAAQGIQMILQGCQVLSAVPDAVQRAQSSVEQAAGVIGADAESAYHGLLTASQLIPQLYFDVSSRASQTSAIVRNFLNSDPVQISLPDEGLRQSVSGLYFSVRGIGEQVDGLNRAINTAAPILDSDIQAIITQYTVLSDLVTDSISEATNVNLRDYILDASDEAADSVTNGKLLCNQNSGAISGDISVGGVVGSMSVEFELDPENDLASNFSLTQRQQQVLKVILQNCTNTGRVTAKKNYTASVCGKQELGLILGCEGYGEAESTQGGYVGGIAGYSCGRIRDSWAKCLLRGTNYLGGIVGACTNSSLTDTAGTVTGCGSLVSIPDAAQYVGAISGGEAGSFEGNFFVSDQLAGINRISYAGKAEPISYSDFLKKPNTPAAFRSFTLTFKAEDKILKTQSFQYGDSFPQSVYPAVPEKEDNYGVWKPEKLEHLHFDTVVTVEYTQHTTAIGSGMKRTASRPAFLIEGEFRKEDSVEYSSVPPTMSGALEQWQLHIPMQDSQTHTVRFLPARQDAENELYLKSGESWQKLEPEKIGSYYIFRVDQSDVTVAVKPAARSHLWSILIAAALVLVIVLVIVLIVRNRKKKKRKKLLSQIPLCKQ